MPRKRPIIPVSNPQDQLLKITLIIAEYQKLVHLFPFIYFPFLFLTFQTMKYLSVCPQDRNEKSIKSTQIKQFVLFGINYLKSI